MKDIACNCLDVELPGKPFTDRVADPKVLERLLEWARTADDKASRFALLALGLSLFWAYYTVLVPVTASSRLRSLNADLLLLDRLYSRLADVQKQMRNVAKVQPHRFSPNNQSIPFFVDVLLNRLVTDRRITLRPSERRDAMALRANLADLAVVIERYRAFNELYAGTVEPGQPAALSWPARDGDPSEVLSDLERAEEVMFELRDLNTQGTNSDWLDAVERTLIADGERVRLATTITGSLAPYETLVGTWAAAEHTPPIGSHRDVAARNGERPPRTLNELRILREKLKGLRNDAESDLQVRRLRVPFTEIQLDRRLFLAIGPLVVMLLYHYLFIYLVLARQIEIFIGTLWGNTAANIASQLRPSDALFRSFDDGATVPSLVRAVRRPVRWFTHGALRAVPTILVVTAAVMSLQDASVGVGAIVITLAIACAGYALLLAYGLQKVTSVT